MPGRSCRRDGRSSWLSPLRGRRSWGWGGRVCGRGGRLRVVASLLPGVKLYVVVRRRRRVVWWGRGLVVLSPWLGPANAPRAVRIGTRGFNTIRGVAPEGVVRGAVWQRGAYRGIDSVRFTHARKPAAVVNATRDFDRLAVIRRRWRLLGFLGLCGLLLPRVAAPSSLVAHVGVGTRVVNGNPVIALPRCR